MLSAAKHLCIGHEPYVQLRAELRPSFSPSVARTVIPSVAREPYSRHDSLQTPPKNRYPPPLFQSERSEDCHPERSEGTLFPPRFVANSVERLLPCSHVLQSERSEDCHPERSEGTLFPPQIKMSLRYNPSLHSSSRASLGDPGQNGIRRERI